MARRPTHARWGSTPGPVRAPQLLAAPALGIAVCSALPRLRGPVDKAEDPGPTTLTAQGERQQEPGPAECEEEAGRRQAEGWSWEGPCRRRGSGADVLRTSRLLWDKQPGPGNGTSKGPGAGACALSRRRLE